MDTLTLKLRGMSCASCAASIEKAIRSVPGVSEASLNFGVEQATVKYDSQRTSLEKIQQAVAAAGYSALPLAEIATGNHAETDRQAETQLTRKVGVGGVISVLLVVGSLSMMTGLSLPWIPTGLDHPWLQLLLTMPVQFWCGTPSTGGPGKPLSVAGPRWIR